MAFLAKALFQWNKSLKNADISILSDFLAIFSDFFLHIEKFYRVLSTCQISDQLDHPNRNYMGGGEDSAPPPPAIPICKKPALFEVNMFFKVQPGLGPQCLCAEMVSITAWLGNNTLAERNRK